jgi:hypothetical protein
MKTTLFLSVLFCAIALPVFGELTETDLNKIRLIINEEIEEAIKPIKADIVTLQTDVAWVRGKLDGIDKQITHGTNITYGLMALIVAAVVIPQILIMLRSGRDRALERQVEMLTQEVETLKQQRIVNP